MTSPTEKNINEAIDWLQQTGGAIQDFAVEQAPLYCREVVAWHLATGLMTVAISILLGLMGVWLIRQTRTLHKAGDASLIFTSLAAVCAVVLAGVLIFRGGTCAIKAAVAPRLVIVEHLRGLTTGSTAH